MKRSILACLLAAPMLAGCPAVEGDSSEVRLLHLSPDAPPVDVFVNDSPIPLVTGLAFEKGTIYLEVPAGATSIHIAAEGDAVEDAVLVVRDLDLEPDARYSAVAYDRLDDLKALALLDDDVGIATGETRLQISHTAVDVPSVDIWELDGPTRVVDDLEFGETTSLDIRSGALSLGLDVDEDGVPDLVFDIPSLPGQGLVNVYAVADDDGPFLVAHLPEGDTLRIAPEQQPAIQ